MRMLAITVGIFAGLTSGLAAQYPCNSYPSYYVQPRPIRTVAPNAVQRPAPPSGRRPVEPRSRQPVIHESRSTHQSFWRGAETSPPSEVRHDEYPVARAAFASGSSKDDSEVRFWNLTDQPIELRANGQNFTLPRGRSRIETLPRRFLWQVRGHDPVTTETPDERPGVVIVLRPVEPTIASR